MIRSVESSLKRQEPCDQTRAARSDPPNPPLPRGGENWSARLYSPLPRGGEKSSSAPRIWFLGSCGCVCFFCCWTALCFSGFTRAGQNQKLDPAAWGSDHVGQAVPEYLTGDECLFCHRGNVGPGWASNRHNLTMHTLEPGTPLLSVLKKGIGDPFATDAKIELGGKRLTRFLKPSEMYGKFELLSAERLPAAAGKDGELRNTNNPHWDAKAFGDNCVGCHATGVDSKTRAASSPSLDCYTCHGAVDPRHSKDPALVHLSRKRNDPANVAISICAQCHARGGKSRSSGLPFPNNFVGGDNLFRDFQIDLSPQAIEKLDPADRHIMENIRDVTILGQNEVTCLSCHQVHKQSTLPHRRLVKSAICLDCHNATGSMKVRKSYEVHSKTCGY
jgi:Cytochrome c554 and c-prime